MFSLSVSSENAVISPAAMIAPPSIIVTAPVDADSVILPLLAIALVSNPPSAIISTVNVFCPPIL